MVEVSGYFVGIYFYFFGQVVVYISIGLMEYEVINFFVWYFCGSEYIFYCFGDFVEYKIKYICFFYVGLFIGVDIVVFIYYFFLDCFCIIRIVVVISIYFD